MLRRFLPLKIFISIGLGNDLFKGYPYFRCVKKLPVLLQSANRIYATLYFRFIATTLFTVA